jgi:hypothetical protein
VGRPLRKVDGVQRKVGGWSPGKGGWVEH